jgi:hypothetical protein
VNSNIEGKCLCGACTYETKTEEINARVCHCRLCQKATGGAFFGRILVPLDKLNFTGPVKWYNSSPELQRGFCSNCGTALFSRRQSQNAVGISVGSLSDPSIFKPNEHIWTSERQPWLNFADGLPEYEGGAATMKQQLPARLAGGRSCVKLDETADPLSTISGPARLRL